MHFILSYLVVVKKLVLLENGTEVCIDGGWGTDTDIYWRVSI